MPSTQLSSAKDDNIKEQPLPSLAMSTDPNGPEQRHGAMRLRGGFFVRHSLAVFQFLLLIVSFFRKFMRVVDAVALTGCVTAGADATCNEAQAKRCVSVCYSTIPVPYPYIRMSSIP